MILFDSWNCSKLLIKSFLSNEKKKQTLTANCAIDKLLLSILIKITVA